MNRGFGKLSAILRVTHPRYRSCHLTDTYLVSAIVLTQICLYFVTANSFIHKLLCENASSPLKKFLKRRDVIKYDEK